MYRTHTHRRITSRPFRGQVGNLRRTGQLAVLAATLATFGAACEGDDDNGLSAEACDAYAELQSAFFGDPAQLVPAAQAFAAVTPEDLSDPVDVLVAALSSEDPAASETPEYAAAQTDVATAVYEDCAAETKADVTGIDYRFEGLPTEVDAGRLSVRLTNDSEADEPHELIIVTGANGETPAELQALPMEELFAAARPVAVAFTSAPGGVATALVDLEPGEYLVICTLPVGGFEAAQDGPGDPHSNHGMVATLTVA